MRQLGSKCRNEQHKYSEITVDTLYLQAYTYNTLTTIKLLFICKQIMKNLLFYILDIFTLTLNQILINRSNNKENLFSFKRNPMSLEYGKLS